MAKPICKSESRWAYWRKEAHEIHRGCNPDKFVRWAKRQMAKARRRFLKSTTAE